MSLLALLARTPPVVAPDPGPGPAPSLPYPVPAAAPYNVREHTITPTDDGTGHSIHPSVLDFGSDGWNGHRFWMTTTAFFQAEEPRENPHIYHSDDGFTWEWPEGVTNPLDPWPGEGTSERWYNSDSHLAYDPDANALVLTWREVRHTRKSQTIWARTSKDGSTWTPAQIIHEVTDDTNYWSTSQSLVRHSETEWRLYYAAGSGTGGWNRYFTAPTWAGPFTSPKAITYTGTATSAYHGDILRRADGTYFGVIQSDGREYPVISADGINFTSAPPILQPGTYGGNRQTLYKSCAVPDALDPSMVNVWYTSHGEWGRWVCYTRVPLSAWGG